MNFAYYVNYTLDGFKSIKLSEHGGNNHPVISALRGSEGLFDVLSTLSLQQGKMLFRRQRIVIKSNAYIAFSVYKGVAEIKQARAGCFLGWTVVFDQQPNLNGAHIGEKIQSLLDSLDEQIVSNNRFISDPTDLAIEKTLMDALPDNPRGAYALFDDVGVINRDTKSGKIRPTLFFSDDYLPFVFDQICQTWEEKEVDFFLAGGSKAEEFSLAKTKLDISPWPIPAPVVKPVLPSPTPLPPPINKRDLNPSEKEEKSAASEILLNKIKEELLGQKTTINQIMMALIAGLSAALLLTGGGLWLVTSRMHSQIAELKAEIQTIGATVTQAKSPSKASAPITSAENPSPVVVVQFTVGSDSASMATIHQIKCPKTTQAGKNELAEVNLENFKIVFEKLNPSIDITKPLKKGVVYSLPKECRPKV